MPLVCEASNASGHRLPPNCVLSESFRTASGRQYGAMDLLDSISFISFAQGKLKWSQFLNRLLTSCEHTRSSIPLRQSLQGGFLCHTFGIVARSILRRGYIYRHLEGKCFRRTPGM